MGGRTDLRMDGWMGRRGRCADIPSSLACWRSTLRSPPSRPASCRVRRLPQQPHGAPWEGAERRRTEASARPRGAARADAARVRGQHCPGAEGGRTCGVARCDVRAHATCAVRGDVLARCLAMGSWEGPSGSGRQPSLYVRMRRLTAGALSYAPRRVEGSRRTRDM